MHPESMRSMERALQFVSEKVPPPAKVLDVGSFDVNGTYRPLVEGLGYEYTGCDIQEGPNVDVVIPQGGLMVLWRDEFDIVISGQTLEHCERPDVLLFDMANVLRPGGYLIINTHHSFPEHRFPKDYWRFMQDGLTLLLTNTWLLTDIDVYYVDHRDIQAIARRA